MPTVQWTAAAGFELVVEHEYDRSSPARAALGPMRRSESGATAREEGEKIVISLSAAQFEFLLWRANETARHLKT